MFWYIMKDIILPKGISKLPHNLGEAKHGRLKASDWLTLFTLVIPLILPEMFLEGTSEINPNSIRAKFLQNTCDLIQCTRIACGRVVREGHAARFSKAYERYINSSKELYNNPRIKPNHHFALHIPYQLKIWGTLMGVAEFAGERLIGLLQKIRTNNRINDIQGALMERVHQKQRLLGKYGMVNEFMEMEGDSKGEKRKKMINLADEIYDLMLMMVREKRVNTRDYCWLPHPPRSVILSPSAIPIWSTKIANQVIITTIAPNNVVVFKRNGHFHYGHVKYIYAFNIETNQSEVGILISQILNFHPQQKLANRQMGYYLQLLGAVLGILKRDSMVML
ncbi:hypothetical protein O181_010245 [Austropuccinia psidii MF-1]|uniref:Uncharacterized protein n=1 Tax=Austropuccinia psidii MF-1 TaxID=1389203 RepID=A0A9Q3GKP6_9BASI|nr:hypothetical protein [Austropuccinia psidii MF-1]